MNTRTVQAGLLPLLAALYLPAALAGQVEVNWTDTTHYTDIRSTAGSQQRFKDRVLDNLEASFKLAGVKLPASHTLTVDVRDVDLAGYIDYFVPAYPFGVRLVRDIDFPRIKVDYQLRDNNGTVISAGSDELRDLSFLYPQWGLRDTDPLKYEKRMIDRWVRNTF